MSDHDPFGLEDDSDGTVFRPSAPKRPVERPRGPRRDPAPGPVPETLGAAIGNRLAEAFYGVLSLVPELGQAMAPDDPSHLRERMASALAAGRDRLVGSGVNPERAAEALWFMAATVDDVVLNTPWGARSGWPQRSLVTQFSGDVTAGEKFFVLAEEHLRFPERDREMLELVFYCLGLGFRGKYRRVQGGEAQLAQFRDQVGRALRKRPGAVLSPRWQGVEVPDEKRRFTVPLLSLPVFAAALAALLYLGLDLRLGAEARRTLAAAEQLPPRAQLAIYRPDQPPVTVREDPDPVPVEPAEVLSVLPALEAALPEADWARIVRSDETPTLARVRLQGVEGDVFASARATINPGYEAILQAVAALILENREVIRAVIVEGHTDSVAVSASNPFGSNDRLSEARAQTVADILVGHGVPPELVDVRGRGSADPIESNETRPGRAANRRVEILIEKGL